jgi:hypothetical protein
MREMQMHETKYINGTEVRLSAADGPNLIIGKYQQILHIGKRPQNEYRVTITPEGEITYTYKPQHVDLEAISGKKNLPVVSVREADGRITTTISLTRGEEKFGDSIIEYALPRKELGSRGGPAELVIVTEAPTAQTPHPQPKIQRVTEPREDLEETEGKPTEWVPIDAVVIDGLRRIKRDSRIGDKPLNIEAAAALDPMHAFRLKAQELFAGEQAGVLGKTLQKMLEPSNHAGNPAEVNQQLLPLVKK